MNFYWEIKIDLARERAEEVRVLEATVACNAKVA